MKVIPLHRPTTNKRCSCRYGRRCRSIGKHPVYSNTKHENLELALSHWKNMPDHNVGIATGKISGIVVLDVDTKSGGRESLRQLTDQHGLIPKTPMVHTSNGGLHYYFKYPQQAGLNLTNRIGMYQGIDLRANGGLVVAPPSLHYSGMLYEWEPNASIEDTKMAEIPGWIMAKLTEQRKTNLVIANKIPDGERNGTVLKIACKLFGLGFDHEEVRQTIDMVNENRCIPELEVEEIERIIKNASRYFL
jgi:putative DNA primase/helicase